MTEAPEPKGRKNVPWLRIVLFFSLAINLLIVGLVAGAIIRSGPSGYVGKKPPLRELGYGPFSQALSRADQRELARAMGDRASDLTNNRAEMRRQFTALLETLRAKPFNADALQAAVVEQQSKLLERQQIGQNLLLERITLMTDEERATFADRLEHALRRPFRRRK